MSDSSKLSNKLKLSQLMDGEWHQLNPSECVVSLCADEALRGSWMRYHLIRDAIRREPVKADQALVARICDAIKDEPGYSNIRPFNGPGMQQPAHSNSEQPSAEQAGKLSASVPDIGRSAGVEQADQLAAKPKAQQMQWSAAGVVDEASNKKVQSKKRKASWLNTGMAGFGLAASVALATVVGLNLFQHQSLDEVSTVASNETAGSANVTAPPEVQEILAAADESAQAGTVGDLVAQNDGANLPVVEFVSNDGAYWESLSSSERAVDEERLNMMLSLHIENSPTTSREGLLPYSRLVGYNENNTGR